jgi:LmbE family N-acetylglucosaminyl deacetylase
MNAQQVAAQREQEARAAAELLGISEVAFLRYPDGDVENTHELREQLVEYIRRWQPTVLFTHDPEHPYPAYITHRDHRIVGRAALDAVYPLARDRLAFPEHSQAGLSPYIVREVWLFSSLNPDSHVDISRSFERKIAARLAHASQTSDPDALQQGWRERAAAIGQPVGLPLAEAFVILKLE